MDNPHGRPPLSGREKFALTVAAIVVLAVAGFAAKEGRGLYMAKPAAPRRPAFIASRRVSVSLFIIIRLLVQRRRVRQWVDSTRKMNPQLTATAALLRSSRTRVRRFGAGGSGAPSADTQ